MLSPGNYVIGGLSTFDDYVAGNLFNCCPNCCEGGNESITTAPGIDFIENRTNNSTTFGYPGEWGGHRFDAGEFGPSFQFDHEPGPGTNTIRT